MKFPILLLFTVIFCFGCGSKKDVQNHFKDSMENNFPMQLNSKSLESLRYYSILNRSVGGYSLKYYYTRGLNCKNIELFIYRKNEGKLFSDYKIQEVNLHSKQDSIAFYHLMQNWGCFRTIALFSKLKLRQLEYRCKKNVSFIETLEEVTYTYFYNYDTAEIEEWKRGMNYEKKIDDLFYLDNEPAFHSKHSNDLE